VILQSITTTYLSALQAALVPTTEKASSRSWLMDEGAIVVKFREDYSIENYFVSRNVSR
jgi:hypothetical protein